MDNLRGGLMDKVMPTAPCAWCRNYDEVCLKKHVIRYVMGGYYCPDYVCRWESPKDPDSDSVW